MLVLTLPQNPLRWAAAIACASFCFFATIVDAANRPIPEVVNVRVFAATQDEHLDLLVRMPLAAVKDIQFPLRDTGSLDLAALQTMLRGAAKYWIAGNFEVADHGEVLTNPDIIATRIAIISDPAFNAYSDARAHFNAPDIGPDEAVFLQQVWIDVQLRYVLANSSPSLTIKPQVAGLGVKVTTELTVVEPSGAERQLSFEGDPGRVYLTPQWHHTFEQFFTQGTLAVVSSADYLVFLFCLALPFRRHRDIAPATVTFCIAIVLSALAVGIGLASDSLWFRSLVDVGVAAAIVLLAAANIINHVGARRRALFALVAGAIFGLLSAFRFAAVEQFAGDHPILAATAYTLGIVLTVVLAIALFIPLLRLLFSFGRVESLQRIIVSALAADTVWSWLLERWSQFRRVPFQTEFGASLTATTLSALAGAALLGGVLWFLNKWLKSHGFAADVTPASDTGA